MNRRADWTFRIYQESKLHDSQQFLTLTYSDEKLPVGGTLVKEHFQSFMKRLRKDVSPVKLRFYAVGEYGTETKRPHYHAIMFGMPTPERLESIWGFGYVDVAKVEMASIHYVTKYHVNRYGDHSGREPPFCLMSRRPGIGTNYMTAQMVKWHKSNQANYAQVNGKITRLPRFYKEKIFNKIERLRFETEAIDRSVTDYLSAVEELRRYHHDADGYYYERLLHMHEHIQHKANTQNTF